MKTQRTRGDTDRKIQRNKSKWFGYVDRMNSEYTQSQLET